MKTIIAALVTFGVLATSLAATAGPLLPSAGVSTVDGPGL